LGGGELHSFKSSSENHHEKVYQFFLKKINLADVVEVTIIHKKI
jgi:hypothetical protein